MISSIKRVVAKFDQSMLNGDMVDQRNAIPFVLQDAQGNEIDASLLRTTYQSILIDTVTVDSQVYPEKAVPIAVNGAYIGEPAEGYEVTGVTITPESVLVAAPSDVLEQFATVMLDAPVDISGAQETRRVLVRMKKLADAQHMSVNEA